MVLGPPFLEEEMPQILDTHFQIALTSEHVAVFGWVSFFERRRWLKNNENTIGMKPNSADDYVGWHNYRTQYVISCA